MSRARVFLAAESLQAGNGGICRVARLMWKVLAEEASRGSLDAKGVVFSDKESPFGGGVPIKLVGQSRSRFACATHKAALSHSHFLYDFLGMARAHCRVPFLRRPFLAWIHGIEVWERTRPDRLAWAKRADYLL